MKGIERGKEKGNEKVKWSDREDDGKRKRITK